MEKSVYTANEALRKENALLKEENAAMTELLEKRGLLSGRRAHRIDYCVS